MKSKKGISLIVLIITIIVIIILAAAVILTLNKNNPIDNSRVAQLAENRLNINSALNVYFGKKMAETQGSLETNQIFLGATAINGVEVTAIVEADDILAAGSNYYELTVEKAKEALDIKLPEITSAKWYLDVTSGLVYLVYEDAENVPAWMYQEGDKTKPMDTTLDQFVKVSSEGNLIDVK